MPRLPSFVLAATIVLFGSLGVGSAVAAERTFVLTPADLVAATELFGAEALSRLPALDKKTLAVRSGAYRFAKGVCPSLLADPTRRLTRVRVLSALGASLVVDKKLAPGLSAARVAIGDVTWQPPESGATRQPGWVTEPPISGAIGFATAGFGIGDQSAGLGAGDAENRVPGFRLVVDVPFDPGLGAVDLALVLTSEAPAKRPGKPGKRTECVLVAPFVPVDLLALRALVAATPLTTITRSRLDSLLDTIQNFLERGALDRAARNARSFALEVAQRTKSEASLPKGEPPIHAGFAEAMITRANAAAEALSF